MNITGGTVTFKRNFQPEQYGSKGAEVSINFVMADGEELGSSLDTVSNMVKAKVLELCNLPIEAKTITVPGDVGAATASKTAAAASMTAAEKKAAKDAAKKAADEAAAAAKKAADDAAAAAKPKTVEEQVGEDLGGFDEDAAETQPEITDAALSTAMNRKVATLKEKHGGAAPKLIKELINTFVEPPKKSHDIPQAQRAAFLTKLEALV